MVSLSPQAKADLQALQTDVKTLQSEVPATLTSQLKADKTTIDNALRSLTPSQWKSLRPAPSSPTTPPSDPTAALTASLKAANVSDAQINQIVSDFQTYQSTLKTVDPTLYVKISADQAAIAQDMPAGHTPGRNHGAGAMGLAVLGPGF
jgi:hypothetical protein